MERHPIGPTWPQLACLLGVEVHDADGESLGEVIGRVLRGTEADLLVRRRRLFRRAAYRRLESELLSACGHGLVYRTHQPHGNAAARQRAESAHNHSRRGDAA